MNQCSQFEADSANELYLDVLDKLASGKAPGILASSPRGMPINELIGASVRLNNAKMCVVTVMERQLNYHFMVAEWWWILTGRRDVASIAPYCKEIGKFSDDGEVFFGAYGPPWRSQVGYVIDKLQKDPDSRQAVLTYWRPIPPDTLDIPCTVATQYLMREDRLHAITTMRSWDAWLGMPYDIFNQARLLAVVSGALQCSVGSLTINAGSLHLYERDQLKARDLTDRLITYDDLELGSLPGLPPPEATEWEGLIRNGVAADFRVTTIPWNHYMAVLRDRHDPGFSKRAGSVFAELL